jgi:flagellar biosynthetic protein FlhB
MAEDFADKTEAPTPHRRAEARRDGNVPRSADLSAAVLCLATLLLLRQYGAGVIAALKVIMVEAFAGGEPSVARIGYLLGTSLMPLLIGLLLIGVAASVLQTGFLFGFRKKTGVLDPAAGFGHLFSGRTAAQLWLNVLKLAAAGAVVYFSARGRIEQALALLDRPTSGLLPAAGALAFAVGIRVAAALVVLGAIDFAYQRFRHGRELRMSRRDVKEELRRQEGDPANKRRRLELMRARLATTATATTAATTMSPGRSRA